jgi:hypothetical protein
VPGKHALHNSSSSSPLEDPGVDGAMPDSSEQVSDGSPSKRRKLLPADQALGDAAGRQAPEEAGEGQDILQEGGAAAAGVRKHGTDKRLDSNVHVAAAPC